MTVSQSGRTLALPLLCLASENSLEAFGPICEWRSVACAARPLFHLLRLPFAALGRFDESNRVFTTVASFAAAGMTLQTIAGFTNEGVPL